MKKKTILLATDLSCRCDRALDRASTLAAEWHARLVVLHVLQTPAEVTNLPSWRQPPDQRQAAEQRVLRDIRGAEGLDLEVLVKRGEPASVILETGRRLGCDLVVTGVARDETLGRLLLGTTVEKLAHKTHVPMLVVKSRTRGPYRNVVVATDFSEGSRYAMEAALELFPTAQISIFHAYHVVFEDFSDDKMAARELVANRTKAESQAFLAATPALANSERVVEAFCEYGQVGELLQDLVQMRDVDLVVIGTHGHGGFTGMSLGHIAYDLLKNLHVDMLVVGRQTS